MHNTQTPTLTDLIGLLDPQTLEILAARLQRVASEEGDKPEQLLLSFIDESLAAHEEVYERGMQRVEMAEAILDTLPETTGA